MPAQATLADPQGFAALPHPRAYVRIDLISV